MHYNDQLCRISREIGSHTILSALELLGSAPGHRPQCSSYKELLEMVFLNDQL